jgi:hypothetical protein
MCIYCGTTKYRKIYEKHFGDIPKDLDGKVFDIHHKDGNHLNNSPDNLLAVSVADHYDIHFEQGDFGACYMMLPRLSLSADEISTLALLNFKKRIKEGTHPFVQGLQKRRVKDGSHNLLGKNNPAHQMVANGTHPWQSKEHAEKSKERLNQIYTCPHCNKSGKKLSMFRYHFDKCKLLTSVEYFV